MFSNSRRYKYFSVDTNSVFCLSSLEISVVLRVDSMDLRKQKTKLGDMVDSSPSTVPDSLCDFQLII